MPIPLAAMLPELHPYLKTTAVICLTYSRIHIQNHSNHYQTNSDYKCDQFTFDPTYHPLASTNTHPRPLTNRSCSYSRPQRSISLHPRLKQKIKGKKRTNYSVPHAFVPWFRFDSWWSALRWKISTSWKHFGCGVADQLKSNSRSIWFEVCSLQAKKKNRRNKLQTRPSMRKWDDDDGQTLPIPFHSRSP